MPPLPPLPPIPPHPPLPTSYEPDKSVFVELSQVQALVSGGYVNIGEINFEFLFIFSN
jgi:hypothetical protein